MELSTIVMWLGFMLASYSVVGNDVIQTLGTGNEFYLGGDDIAFDRLDKIDIPPQLAWYYILPPLVLMLITRFGIPVSTTFLILPFFSPKSLGGMVQKSVMGYLIAFAAGMAIYTLITKLTEKKFIATPMDGSVSDGLWTNKRFWIVAQWLSTGFLWTQWLSQDLANIYVYLGKGDLSILEFVASLIILVGLLGYIFYTRGGKIQDIVRAKTNTNDIRSATFIDLIYGVILLIFKYNYLGLWEAKLPMSTTWVFIGLLGGRELAMAWRLDGRLVKKELKPIVTDLAKVFLGLAVSILLVYVIRFFSGQGF